MARIDVDGIGIEYELLGSEGAPAVALTGGGRFPKESPGISELANALAQGGKRVLLWDRPNCGASDLCFDADTESNLHARTLIKLIRTLDLGPTALAGGSAGSRVSLIAARMDPSQVSHLILWWLSGGPVGLVQLAYIYCGGDANIASWHGMQGVADSPNWADQIQRNPRARETLLSQDVDRYIATMQRWASAYQPSDGSPIPGMSVENFAALTMPVLILRSGSRDVSHTRATTEKVHDLIPHSELIDPPWPDHEWNDRMKAFVAGEAPGVFVNWPALAPAILEFVN